MAASPPKWYVPGSVLSALWGSVMPRLAATVWKGKLKWPPPSAKGELIHENMWAFPVAGKALEEFWRALEKVAFGGKGEYHRALKASKPLSGGQRAAHVVLDYFDPHPKPGRQKSRRLPFRIVRASAYDFVLSSYGLDVFIPQNPFEDENHKRDMKKGQREVLQMYKFRETGKPPIGLPGVPATFSGGDNYLIPIPQLTSPTGAFQVHEDWAKGLANDVAWWISGTSYRGMMAALPRIIASMWYEEVVWPREPLKVNGAANPNTTRGRFEGDLVKLLEERMETRLPQKMQVKVQRRRHRVPGGALGLPDWREWDIMITNEGLYVPHPGPAPSPTALLDAIEKGQAGNPVFTDSSPCVS